MARIVNGREAMLAALRAGETALESPPYAACHAGVNYYKALLEQVRGELPEHPFQFTLCCGDDAAVAHDALRHGFTSVLCACSDGMLSQLQAIGNELGAVVKRPLDPRGDTAIPEAHL